MREKQSRVSLQLYPVLLRIVSMLLLGYLYKWHAQSSHWVHGSSCDMEANR